MHERRRGDVRGGGKGTKVDAGGTITDGKGTTVSTTERAGPPHRARRPAGNSESHAGGRPETKKRTRKGKRKTNDVATDATNKLVRRAKARTFTDPNPSRTEGDGNRTKGNKRGRRRDAEGKRNGTRKRNGGKGTSRRKNETRENEARGKQKDARATENKRAKARARKQASATESKRESAKGEKIEK